MCGWSTAIRCFRYDTVLRVWTNIWTFGEAYDLPPFPNPFDF